jgi:SAM-dependent methyltransferase
MDDSLAPWLRLREPADADARSVALARAVARHTGAHDPVRVLDLACGTGANLRYLAPYLPGRQRWRLVDRDPALLAIVPELTASWAATRGATVVRERDGRFVIRGGGLECHVETQQMDLDALDVTGLAGDRHLVTASALLDLTSERWLHVLADRCRSAGAAALFALTYDGSSTCSPAEPEDDRVRDLLNRHQTRDKGLGGPAAGPDAAAAVVRAFAGAGYHVERAPSPWTLDVSARGLQEQLVAGWAEAATETAPEEAEAIASWRARRLGHIAASRSRIVVGHVDVAAWMAGVPRTMPSKVS